MLVKNLSSRNNKIGYQLTSQNSYDYFETKKKEKEKANKKKK